MKKRICVFFAMLFLCCGLAAAQEPALSDLAQSIYASIAAGEYAQVVEQFDETMRAVLDEAALRLSIESVNAQLGAMTSASLAQMDERTHIAVLLVQHERGQTLMQIAFDAENRVSGLFIQPVAAQETVQPQERTLPEGAQLRTVTLFEGTARELGGELILPVDANAETPYVIFAQGSGPSDRDETVGANKPLRDIAYDLAALGIGSLRFDKITYAAPDWQPLETVDDEYLQPVTEALHVLRQETDAARVYLIGHSEGGMLAPYLVAECGFDGGIVLAGTPKQLWEISYAQNLALLAMMDDEQRESTKAQIDAEAERARTLADMSDEEAANTVVFGMSAVYLRHMAHMDQAQIAKDSGKPFLFLWGEADAQVDREAFEAWEAGLGDGPFVFKTYPRLNHLFIPAQEGENIANVMQAYSVPSRVAPQVALDIADWINTL